MHLTPILFKGYCDSFCFFFQDALNVYNNQNLPVKKLGSFGDRSMRCDLSYTLPHLFLLFFIFKDLVTTSAVSLRGYIAWAFSVTITQIVYILLNR